MAVLVGKGLRQKAKKHLVEKKTEINIHLSRVFDFRPLIFGSFVAFPEIQRFAVNTHFRHKLFVFFVTFKTLMLRQ